MGTEKDFKVKKGLTVTDNISVSGDIDVSSLYGRLNFKKNADGNVNNDAIFFINGSDQYAGAVKYFHSTNTLRFDANQETQLHISDGAIFPPTDDDVDLGTSSLKFKDSFFGLVDAENFKINGGQGSDGQVLTSTGSGVAWEDVAGGDTNAGGVNGSQSAPTFSFASDTNTGMYLRSADHISWTTGGNRRLSLSTSALEFNGVNIHNIDGSASTPSYTFDLNTNTGIFRPADFTIGFSTGGTERLRIGSSGELLISGSSAGSSGQVLTSQGSSSAPAWTTISSGGASALDDLSDAKTFATDNIGIGENTMSAENTGAQYNYAFGKGALQDLTTGDRNNAFGLYALGDITTTSYNVAMGDFAARNATGTGNTAIGRDAGRNITTGSYNTYLGYQAGSPNGTQSGTGDHNIGIGRLAAREMQSGTRNIAIGAYALDAADTESDNIAIGYDALGGSVAGGEKNVMIGNYAGDSITSGFDNVGIGHLAHTGGTGFFNVSIGSEAGKAMTSNSYQTLVGYQAGQSFNGTNAKHNTAVGYQAMGGGTSSPHQNTALGSSALYNVNGVSRNNIGIGYNAGVNQTAGSGNIIIGAAIDLPSTSGSRQLKIAGNDGSTTTTWITGDSDGGLVLGKEGAGVVQVGDSSLNPSGINLGKFIVSRDDSGSSPAGPTMSLVDSDDDANAGPILKMYRNTASPADDDALGVISFNGEDSVGGERGYVRIRAISDNVTSGSNSGSLEFRIFANGTQTEVMQLEPDAQAGAKMTLMGVSQTGAVVSGASTANNAYLNLLTVAHGTHKAITASAHITDSTNNEVQTEMIVAHYDGSAVNYTTYGQIFDGAAAIGALEANLSGSNIIIQFKNTQGSTATIAGSIHATMHP